jgi:hypothetical protein
MPSPAAVSLAQDKPERIFRILRTSRPRKKALGKENATPDSDTKDTAAGSLSGRS